MTTAGRLVLVIACCALAPGFASAQAPSAAPVVAPPSSDLTEERARDLVLAHGFYGVGRLKLDVHGAWRGIAIQYGQTFNVEVDARGNFTSAEK